MTETDCVVIGAGVIGLAVARALAIAGREVVVLERERQFGAAISSRNSEVIHAGLYYPPNSLKAQLCVAGQRLLYDYCESRRIAYRKCGKLVVATCADQLTQLHAIESRARHNGVTELLWIEGAEARRMEPALKCTAALSSPTTGIIDSHAYMLSLAAEAEANGAVIAYGVAVTALFPTHDGIEIAMASHEPAVLRSRLVINATGLQAAQVAASIADFPAGHIPRIQLAKGSYFDLIGRSPFARLIYPVPELSGLGIHLTIDLAGRARFGPDVEWVDNLDYDVDAARSKLFYPEIRRYWPQLRDGQLQPALTRGCGRSSRDRGSRPLIFVSPTHATRRGGDYQFVWDRISV